MLRVHNHQTQRATTFAFDKVFDEETNQCTIYDEIDPLVTSVMDGFNICVMAYGQTGSGKTYTMVFTLVTQLMRHITGRNTKRSRFGADGFRKDL